MGLGQLGAKISLIKKGEPEIPSPVKEYEVDVSPSHQKSAGLGLKLVLPNPISNRIIAKGTRLRPKNMNSE